MRGREGLVGSRQAWRVCGGWVAVAWGSVCAKVDRSSHFEEFVHSAYGIHIATILNKILTKKIANDLAIIRTFSEVLTEVFERYLGLCFNH
jgi:hypothetical protein